MEEIEKHSKSFYIRANRCSSLYNDILPDALTASSSFSSRSSNRCMVTLKSIPFTSLFITLFRFYINFIKPRLFYYPLFRSKKQVSFQKRCANKKEDSLHEVLFFDSKMANCYYYSPMGSLCLFDTLAKTLSLLLRSTSQTALTTPAPQDRVLQTCRNLKRHHPERCWQ